MEKQTRKIVIAISGLLVLAVLIVAFANFTGLSVKESETIKVGWTGPLTGPSAVLGFDSVTAAEIAVKEINQNGGINGKMIELIVEDDQYNTQKTVNAYNKLVNVDDVDIIIMNTYGSVLALADRAREDNVIIIDPLDCNSELSSLNENVFCLATDTESIGVVLANEADVRSERVGIIYFNSDRFMPLVKNIFQTKYNGEIVGSESIPVGTSDFKTILTKMIVKDVDGIVLLGYDEMGIAMKQARDLGFEGQFYMPGTVTSPGLQEAAKGNAEETILAFWNAEKEKEPTKSFSQEFNIIKGRDPILDLATYPTYDTVMVLALAVENAESENVDDIKDEILRVSGYKGVTGNIDFKGERAMLIEESAFIIKDGRPVAL